jgi:hypothetical protein
MTTQQFDARLRHIEEQYAARRAGADAYRDQELARLFTECEWTQERIAGQMGRRQAWVSYRLVFGRFLAFITTGDNPNRDLIDTLTERRFRQHWKQTKGKEPARFAEVAHRLEHGIAQGHQALVEKPGIKAAIEDVLADGQWYTTAQIAATAEESLPGVTTEQVSNSMKSIHDRPPDGVKLQRKKIGKKCQYRLARRKAGADAHADALVELYEEARPIIEELRQWGRSSRWQQAPGELLKLAVQLERLFERRLPKVNA